jgi:hypothetical protein
MCALHRGFETAELCEGTFRRATADAIGRFVQFFQTSLARDDSTMVKELTAFLAATKRAGRSFRGRSAERTSAARSDQTGGAASRL